MDIRYTKCTRKEQVIHGVRDWNKAFKVTPKDGAGPYTVIRARSGSKLLGQVVVVDDWIVFLVVNPNYRGKGIGSELLTKAENVIFNKGEKVANLHPQKEFQDKLIPWYEKMGYSVIGFDDKVGEYHMVKHNTALKESKDYKYKAKVGDFWLQKDVNKEWSVCDDEAEADEFESETEPTQIINQMKKDGKVKKDTKYKIVKIKENKAMAKKPLKEATEDYKSFEDVVEGDSGHDYSGEPVVILDKGTASDFEWAQGYETLEELADGEDVDTAFPECVLVELDGEQILYSYGGDGVVVDANSDPTRVRQISFDFIDDGSFSAEDIISRIQDAMATAGIEIVGGPNFGDTSWSKDEYGLEK